MTLKKFLKSTDLEKSLLIGYYGGGNYGDELLLEILQNLFVKYDVKDLAIAYQYPDEFEVLHRELGFKRVPIRSKWALLKTTFDRKNIIIGGGGLWGQDINPNTFMMSIYLLICRRLLRKKVYLLGVGYYNSTTRLGHIGAWAAAKAANLILARDQESYRSFQKLNKRAYFDRDIAWQADELDLRPYQKEAESLAAILPVKTKTLFISLRSFKHPNNYTKILGEFLKGNRRPVILAVLELERADPKSFRELRKLKNKYSEIQIMDFAVNPLALFLFFKQNFNKLGLAGPQFHIILTAQMAGVPFLPISYDNKVGELLDSLNIPEIPINDLTINKLQTFADSFFSHKGANK